MRRTLSTLVLLLAACSSPPAPPPAVAPSPGVSASASAAPAPRFDPARPDAAVLELLAAVPAPGPLEGALNQASRDDLTRALGHLSDEEKATLRENPHFNADIKPLLLAAMKPDDTQALHELCCRGHAWKGLRILRQQEGPAEDLAPGARRVIQWAARSFADRSARSGRPPVTAAEADRLLEVARILDHPPLEAAASALAAALEPTPTRLSAAAFAAAENLDVPAAKKHLAALKAGDTKALSPRTLPGLESEISQAEELLRLGTTQVSKENAPQAAELATRLGRDELVPKILERAGNIEGDLRAVAASVSAQIEGTSCMRLEWSREPLEVCAQLWDQNPERKAILERMDRALQGGKGHSPWALEAYLGITQILPMTYTFLGGQISSPAQFLELLGQYQKGIQKGLAAEGVSPLHRDALGLFADTLLQAATTAVNASTAGWKIDDATANRLSEQATAVLERHPRDTLAHQSALAVAMFLFRSRDTGPILRRIPDNPMLSPTRARATAFLGALRNQKDLLEDGLRSLDAPPSWLSPEYAARDHLLAAEIRAAMAPTPANLEALLTQLTTPPAHPTTPPNQPSTPPTPPDPLDQLQRLIDQAGALARLGRRAEVEPLIAQRIQDIHADTRDSSTVDLLGTLQSLVAGLMATSLDPVEQRKGMGRLQDLVFAPETNLSEAVQLYRVLVLQELLGQGRTACVTTEAGCRASMKKLKEYAEKERKALEPKVMPEQQKLLERGALLAGSNVRMSFGYNPGAGLGLTLEYTPRLLQVPPPKEVRPAKKPR